MKIRYAAAAVTAAIAIGIGIALIATREGQQIPAPVSVGTIETPAPAETLQPALVETTNAPSTNVVASITIPVTVDAAFEDYNGK